MPTLKISEINTGGGTQTRAKLDLEHVEAIKASWNEIGDIPPLVVFHDGSTYWLADGFHRFHAANGTKLRVNVEIKTGTQRDAILYACGANQTHGLKRSNADKRKAVKTLLDDQEWSKKSDRWVAETAGVNNHMVSELRAELSSQVGVLPPEHQETPGKSQKRVGKDGKEQPAKKPKKEATFDPKEFDKPKPEKPVEPKLETFAEKVKHQNHSIESFAKRLMAEFDGNLPDDPWLDESRVGIARDLLKSVQATLRLAKAHDQPCPKCEGKGCKVCRKCGYLPKNDYLMMGGQ